MKKLSAITLVMVLAISLLTACNGGGNSNTGGNNNSPADNSTPSGNNTPSNTPDSTPSGNDSTPSGDDGILTMSITVAAGWKEKEGSSYDVAKERGELHYVPDMAVLPDYIGAPTEIRLIVEKMSLLAALTDYTMNSGEREFVEKYIKNIQAAYTTQSYDYSSITELMVGGHKAFEFTYSSKGGGARVRTTIIYNNGGEYAYFIEQHTQKEIWETALPDFDAMLGSFTLE
jgi:hypothetical protein